MERTSRGESARGQRMKELGAQKIAELSSWQAVLLRVTVFVEGDPRNDADTWWTGVVENDAENSTSRNRGLERSLDGEFAGRRLTLQTQSGRADWLSAVEMGKVSLGQTAAEPEAAADSFLGALETFVSAMKRWLVSVEAVKRFAFGAIMRLPMQSGWEAYSKISAYLPFDVNADLHTDLLFQINVPRSSDVLGADVTINRLSKWGVVRSQLYGLEIRPGEILPTSLAPPAYACQIELDVNTAERTTPLPGEHLVELFDEMVSLAKAIAEKGVSDDFPPSRSRGD